MEISQGAARKPASWVIREKATAAVLVETFDPRKVAALNTTRYEAVPIEQHLASLNRRPASITLEAARQAVAGEVPAPSSSANLKARVLWTLGPRRYGGRLTAERVAGIIGDPDRAGCSLEPERALSVLRELQAQALVVLEPRSGTYRLAPEVLP